RLRERDADESALDVDRLLAAHVAVAERLHLEVADHWEGGQVGGEVDLLRRGSRKREQQTPAAAGRRDPRRSIMTPRGQEGKPAAATPRAARAPRAGGAR